MSRAVAALDHVRQEWEEGHRRLAAARDTPDYERLMAQVEVVRDELRRRVGETFTLADLATAFGDADSWSREAIGEHAPSPGWVRTASIVESAAFHLYSRGAVDYRP